MGVILKKMLSVAEKKWSYIQIPSKKVSEFPEKFNLYYGDKIFSAYINKAHRVVSKQLFLELGLRIGSIVTIEKNDDKYSITFKPGLKNSM